MDKSYDFSGWATRNNLRCSDGRTIRKDCFKHQNGKKVPLVWNHQHDGVGDVLGHAILENREEGVYAYGYLNHTENGEMAKALLEHGDIESLSIYAGQLQQVGGDVIHGNIKEVSLVLAGANPGAVIDTVLEHSDGTISEGAFYMDDGCADLLMHSDKDEEEEEDEKEDKKLLQSVDAAEFNRRLGDEYALLVRLHPQIHRCEEMLEGVIDVTAYEDVGELTLACDIMVTDYSSVCMDAALIRKPLYFYAFDYAKYNKDRSFYFDYETYVPGPVAKDFTTLLSMIENESAKEYIERAEEFRTFNFGNPDNKASSRVVDTIIK